MREIQSKFFEFVNFKNQILNTELYYYLGWNSLIVAKIQLKKNDTLDSVKIDKNFSQLTNKQKIFVLTEGQCVFEVNNKEYIFNEFDAVDLVSGDEQYEIKAKENSLLFMVSAFDLEKQSGISKFFNFKKDIKSKNLWGGQIISRPYEGGGLTFVLFDLKKGFKFEDKGHPNEQITWLISGEMDFYTNKKHKKLNKNNAVDIGPNHLHGGVSAGATGFDVFFPKREELKYKN